jgi:hypothetical protein
MGRCNLTSRWSFSWKTEIRTVKSETYSAWISCNTWQATAWSRVNSQKLQSDGTDLVSRNAQSLDKQRHLEGELWQVQKLKTKECRLGKCSVKPWGLQVYTVATTAAYTRVTRATETSAALTRWIRSLILAASKEVPEVTAVSIQFVVNRITRCEERAKKCWEADGQIALRNAN